MPATAAVVAFPPMLPTARLDAALCRLREALRAQGQAVAAWRHSLEDLRASAARLECSVRSYDARLASLATGIAELHGTARQMEALADGMLRK